MTDSMVLNNKKSQNHTSEIQYPRKYDIHINHKKGKFTDKINYIRDIILSAVPVKNIKQIYLFGSYAYGKPNKDSDIDICIILYNTADEHDCYMKIAKEFLHKEILPSDILVYTEKKFYLTSDPNYSFYNPKDVYHTIREKGKLLYG